MSAHAAIRAKIRHHKKGARSLERKKVVAKKKLDHARALFEKAEKAHHAVLQDIHRHEEALRALPSETHARRPKAKAKSKKKR